MEVGTCAIKGTMSGVNRQGVQIKCRFNLTGKIRTNGWKHGENYHIKCRVTGPLEYESVNTKGKRKAATVEGSSTITFREYYDPHAYEDDEEE